MKFNKPVKTPVRQQTINEAGGISYEMTERQKLIHLALNANFQETYYKSGNQQLDELRDILRNTKDPLFAAKVAVYARHEHGARAVSHVIAAELAKRIKGSDWTKNFINAVIYRPDDALEILGYYINTFGKRPIPNSFKKGALDALMGFDEYQFAKYKKERSEVSLLKDLVMLIHPTPSVKNHIAIKKLLDGKLKQVNTAQAKLSEAGKKETVKEVKEARKEALNDLINEKKLGYSALIVNFIDIMNEASEDEFNKACEYMINPEAIKKSLMYPMKYFILYQALMQSKKINIKRVNKATMVINKAMEIAFQNVPEFKGKKILLAQDVSGSMNGTTISVKHGDGKNAVEVTTRVSNYASLFITALLKSNNDIRYIRFNNTAEDYTGRINLVDSFMTIVDKLSCSGGGTDFDSIFQFASLQREKYDLIIIISDNESWGHSESLNMRIKEYRKLSGKNTKLISWDLANTTKELSTDKNYAMLSGYSAKVFDVMGQLVNEEARLEKLIDAIDFKKYITVVPAYKGKKQEPESKSTAKRVDIQKTKETLTPPKKYALNSSNNPWSKANTKKVRVVKK